MAHFLIATGILLFGMLLLIAATSRHKKHSGTFHLLMGKQGKAYGELTPDGAVLIDGEMWPAVSKEGNNIRDGKTITVVGARLAHLLVSEL